jgi:hypothetical protein
MEQNEFCKCDEIKSVHSESDDFGHWDVCNECNKPIEDSYEYDNQSDEDY